MKLSLFILLSLYVVAVALLMWCQFKSYVQQIHTCTVHVCLFAVSRAFMAGVASQAGDVDFSLAPSLTSDFQGSIVCVIMTELILNIGSVLIFHWNRYINYVSLLKCPRIIVGEVWLPVLFVLTLNFKFCHFYKEVAQDIAV